MENSRRKPGVSRQDTIPATILYMLTVDQHDRMTVERRVADAPSDSRSRNVKTSDIARLMELFQVTSL